jgi:hypothetical protein
MGALRYQRPLCLACTLSAALVGAQAEQPDIPVPGKPRSLGHVIWGWTGSGPVNVFDLLKSPLAQTICLTVSREAKAVDRIAQEIEAPAEAVGTQAERLVTEGVLVRTDDGRYRAGFLALDAAAHAEISRLTADAGAAAAEIVRANLERVRPAYEDAPVSRQGFGWDEQAVWPVVAVLLCNAAFRRAGPLKVGPYPERASGGRYWLIGREPIPGGGAAHGLSLSANQLGPLRWAAFGTPGAWRQLPELSEAAREALAAVACGRPADEAALEEPLQLGLLTNKGGVLRLTFPLFGETDSLLLTPILDDIADRMWGEAAAPHLAGLEESLDAWGYGALRAQYPVLRASTAAHVTDGCIGALIDQGVLPPPPTSPPPGFAYLAWEQGLRLMEW